MFRLRFVNSSHLYLPICRNRADGGRVPDDDSARYP